MRVIAAISLMFLAYSASAETEEVLVKFKDQSHVRGFNMLNQLPSGSQVEDLRLGNWVKFTVPKGGTQSLMLDALRRSPAVLHVQPNYKLQMLENPGLAQMKAQLDDDCPIPGMCDIGGGPGEDNPAIPNPGDSGNGADPLLNSQWGMLDIGAQEAWKKSKGIKKIVVAVIDTGVDYTHEDLRGNLWRNQGEMGTDARGRDRSSNGIDDDGNGYVDDVIGWDFVSNDNLPYDLSVSMFELFTGGNPGHGTHCAGNVAARGFNGKGVSGVAPNVSIMSIRFLSEKGQGTTADAVKAVRYAVENGAQVLSNSWGSMGEDTSDGSNQALKDAIQYSLDKGSLFVAAAGNGRQGAGYDNDTDNQRVYPASYDYENIISVAALDVNDQLGAFSNWGRRTVDIGAPGVNVFSTTVGSNYSDKVIDMFGFTITWDGTSMATPHVAGAAALYMSENPNASWKQVKSAILDSATSVSSMNGKSVSGGKLNVIKMLDF